MAATNNLEPEGLVRVDHHESVEQGETQSIEEMTGTIVKARRIEATVSNPSFLCWLRSP